MLYFMYVVSIISFSFFFFFFNDTATTEIYTLSLHDALPIFAGALLAHPEDDVHVALVVRGLGVGERQRLLEEAEVRSEEHTSELQSRPHLVCRLLLEKKKQESDMSLGTRMSEAF